MKKFFYSLCFVLPTAVFAMEVGEQSQLNAAQDNKQQKLFIVNDFNDPVLVAYQLDDSGETQHLRVDSRKAKKLPKFRRIKQLTVTPYGKYYGLMNREKIGLQLTNFTQNIFDEANKDPRQHVYLIIASGLPKIATTYLPAYVSAGVEKVCPYHIYFGMSSIYPTEPDPIPRIRNFTHLNSTLLERAKAGQRIYPRHLIETGEDAPLVDIEREYKQLMDTWVPVSKREVKEDAVFALKLLQGIELAHLALKYEQEFKAFAEENFDLYESFPAKKQ